MKYVVAIAALVGAPLSMAAPSVERVSQPPLFGGGAIVSFAFPLAESLVMPADGRLGSVSIWVEDLSEAAPAGQYRLRFYRGTVNSGPDEFVAEYRVSEGTLEVVPEVSIQVWPSGFLHTQLRFVHDPIEVSEGETIWAAVYPEAGEPPMLWIRGTGGNGLSAGGVDGEFETIGLSGSDMNLSMDLAVGAGGSECPADISGDGVVNFSDLNAVLNNFGQTCE